MGASLSDEYAYNGRAYAENWVEQYATQPDNTQFSQTGGPVNFGALGSYPSPRNQGIRLQLVAIRSHKLSNSEGAGDRACGSDSDGGHSIRRVDGWRRRFFSQY